MILQTFIYNRHVKYIFSFKMLIKIYFPNKQKRYPHLPLIKRHFKKKWDRHNYFQTLL